jgi:hypothetical protein
MKTKFTDWLLKQPDVIMVAADLKPDGKKHPMHLRGDKHPNDTGFYQFSLTGQCGYFDRTGKFHQFGSNTDMVKMVQVDIFG